MIPQVNSVSRQIDNLLVVIVLYKSTLSQSESYQSIRVGFRPFIGNGKKVDLIVVNNGPEHVSCQVDEAVFQLHYVEHLDNPGVSKAYNVAAELANRLGKSWLLLLDQDTQLPADFWHQYRASLDQYPDQPLYAPKLLAGSLLVSPCGYRYYRGYVLNTIVDGICPMQAHNVLNSGLLVSVEALLKVGGYDESVGLYFSDFVFFDRLKKNYSTFVVIDVNLKHDLSSSDYSSISTALQRFNLYSRGARTAAKQGVARSILYFVTVGARSLVMNSRFRTLAFTHTFLKAWFYIDK